jgi:predicted secreted protein
MSYALAEIDPSDWSITPCWECQYLSVRKKERTKKRRRKALKTLDNKQWLRQNEGSIARALEFK